MIDIVNELKEYGINPIIADPQADAEEAKRLYGIEFVDICKIRDMDAVVLAVLHNEFKRGLTIETIRDFFGNADGKRVLLDIKGMLNRKKCEDAGYIYWRL